MEVMMSITPIFHFWINLEALIVSTSELLRPQLLVAARSQRAS